MFLLQGRRQCILGVTDTGYIESGKLNCDDPDGDGEGTPCFFCKDDDSAFSVVTDAGCVESGKLNCDDRDGDGEGTPCFFCKDDDSAFSVVTDAGCVESGKPNCDDPMATVRERRVSSARTTNLVAPQMHK